MMNSFGSAFEFVFWSYQHRRLGRKQHSKLQVLYHKINNSHLYNSYCSLTNRLPRKPAKIDATNACKSPELSESDPKATGKISSMGSESCPKAKRLASHRFPFQVVHHDGHKLAPNQCNRNDRNDSHKDFLNKRQFKLTCLTLALLALAAACSPTEIEASIPKQQQRDLVQKTTAQANDDANRNARSLSNYDFKDWLPGSQEQPATLLSGTGLSSHSSAASAQEASASPAGPAATKTHSSILPIDSTIGSSIATTATSTTTGGAETQLMAPISSSSAPDHMLVAASKKKKKMKMMKKKKKMEKKHKEWKKGKKHKKKKYESKKKKGGSSKKKKGT